MRLAVKKWTDATGLSNPYELKEGQSLEDWENLSAWNEGGEEQKGTSRFPMPPQTIQAVAANTTSSAAAAPLTNIGTPTQPSSVASPSSSPAPQPTPASPASQPTPPPKSQPAGKKPRKISTNMSVSIPGPSAATRKLQSQQGELERQMAVAMRYTDSLKRPQKPQKQPAQSQPSSKKAEKVEKVDAGKGEVREKETETAVAEEKKEVLKEPTPEQKREGMIGRLRGFVGW